MHDPFRENSVEDFESLDDALDALEARDRILRWAPVAVAFTAVMALVAVALVVVVVFFDEARGVGLVTGSLAAGYLGAGVWLSLRLAAARRAQRELRDSVDRVIESGESVRAAGRMVPLDPELADRDREVSFAPPGWKSRLGWTAVTAAAGLYLWFRMPSRVGEAEPLDLYLWAMMGLTAATGVIRALRRAPLLEFRRDELVDRSGVFGVERRIAWSDIRGVRPGTGLEQFATVELSDDAEVTCASRLGSLAARIWRLGRREEEHRVVAVGDLDRQVLTRALRARAGAADGAAVSPSRLGEPPKPEPGPRDDRAE